MIYSKKHTVYVLALAAASLLGCGQESVVHTGAVLSFETNAAYVAVQDSPTGAWQMQLRDNPPERLASKSIVLRDPAKRYGLVFVCPGVDDTSAGGFATVKPNLATAFFSTADELPSVTLVCRERISGSTSGKLVGSIKLDAKSEKFGQEYVDISIGDSISLRAVEAYATEVAAGSYDVLAMKGALNDADEIIPNAFFAGSASSVAQVPGAADIRFTDQFGAATLVDPGGAQQTTATIAGLESLEPGETWIARVGFVGQNKGYLLLKESREPTLDFVRVPANLISRDSGGNVVKTRTRFIGDRQAHELSVRVADAAGIERRAYYRFFADKSTIAAGLPAKVVSQPTVQLNSDATRTIVRAMWSGYADPIAGSGVLYRLEVSGDAVPKAVAATATPPPTRPLTWTSYLTRGWNGADNFDYTLPDLSKAVGWDRNWDLKANQSIAWVQHSYASHSKAGLVVDYLENKKAVDGLDFAVVHQKDVAAPGP